MSNGTPQPPDPKEYSQRTAMDVARELLEQPTLFLQFDGIEGLSPPPMAMKPVAERYTGARSTAPEHDERNLKVGALWLLGASDREIEIACSVTRKTIPLIIASLEKTGRITPLKDRLAQITGENAERANRALRVLLDRVGDNDGSMELASMIKAVATTVGITVEKHLLTTGQATEIIETRSGAGRAEFETWWSEQVIPVQATVTPATESASPATPPISEGIRQSEAARDGSDTATRAPESERMDGDRGGGDGENTAGTETSMG